MSFNLSYGRKRGSVAALLLVFTISFCATHASAQPCPDEVWCISNVYPQVIDSAISHDGTMIAILGMTGPGAGAGISIRSAVDGTLLRTIDVPGLPRWIAWRPGTAHIACSYNTMGNSSEFFVKVWDAGTGAEVVTMTGFTHPSTAGVYSADGSKLATTEQSLFIRIFNADSGAEELLISGASMGGMPECLAFSPDGTQLATGHGAGFQPNTIKIWSVANGQALQTLQLGADAPSVNAVRYSPDGTKLAATNGSGRLVVWKTLDWSELTTFEAAQITGSVGGYDLAFAPDSDLIAWGVGPYPAATVFVRVSTGVTTAICNEAATSGLEFAPDGTWWLRGTDTSGDGACIYETP